VPKKILIAETNGYLSQTLVALCSAFGYEVVETSAENADIIDQIQNFEPNLLLIDFDMSQQIDISAVRAKFPELKVIGSLLHEATDGFTEIAKRSGLDGFISKYAPQEHLIKSIKTILP